MSRMGIRIARASLVGSAMIGFALIRLGGTALGEDWPKWMGAERGYWLARVAFGQHRANASFTLWNELPSRRVCH